MLHPRDSASLHPGPVLLNNYSHPTNTNSRTAVLLHRLRRASVNNYKLCTGAGAIPAPQEALLNSLGEWLVLGVVAGVVFAQTEPLNLASGAMLVLHPHQQPLWLLMWLSSSGLAQAQAAEHSAAQLLLCHRNTCNKPPL